LAAQANDLAGAAEFLPVDRIRDDAYTPLVPTRTT